MPAMTTLSGIEEINMKVYQCATLAWLAWSAALPAVAGASHDSIVIDDRQAAASDALVWNAPELPYARLLASAPGATPYPGLAAGPRPGAAAALPAAQAQPARPITPVPETSMYSMLLVGLGLLALCGAGARQEKFDQGR